MIIKSSDGKQVVSVESGLLMVSPSLKCDNKQGFCYKVQIWLNAEGFKKVCLGQYLSEQRCIDIIGEITNAYSDKQSVYEMPFDDIDI